MSQLHKFLLLALFFSTCITTISSLSCLDREGNAVPWFTLIKYPSSLTKSSARYAYFDPNIGSSTYKIILGSGPDTKGEALPNTIDAINDISSQYLNLLAYNDEPPHKATSSSGAHAKGIVAFDNKTSTGVFIMHSVPKYPTVTETNGFIDVTIPSTAQTYGQNAYCISLNKDNLQTILPHLPVEKPDVYFSSGLFEGVTLTSTGTISQFSLLNGEAQWMLTKSPSEEDFLFEDIIAPYFSVSLAVESWGRPYQKSVCDGAHVVLNIDQIGFNSQDTWGHSSDHSKWAISYGSSEENGGVACLCDMNRMTSQKKRGGSCLCSKNQLLYGALNSIVVSTDKCPSDDEIVVVDYEEVIIIETD